MNLPRYEWLGSAAEIVNTCGDTIRQTTTENDAIAYANVYLEQALGDQFEVLKDCILDVQYNVQGRDFLTAASQVPLLTKASYSNDVLGRYWSTTAGCGWAYLMLHASLQPRIALQKYDESLETNEKAVQVIDIALNKAWDEISESLAPGSWNIIPGDSTADQFFGRLQHELTEGLKYFPEAAKEYPELHLKLVALGPAAKKVICGCFPSNIFFPVYCSHLIESLQNFFLKIPHCFRLVSNFAFICRLRPEPRAVVFHTTVRHHILSHSFLSETLCSGIYLGLFSHRFDVNTDIALFISLNLSRMPEQCFGAPSAMLNVTNGTAILPLASSESS